MLQQNQPCYAISSLKRIQYTIGAFLDTYCGQCWLRSLVMDIQIKGNQIITTKTF